MIQFSADLEFLVITKRAASVIRRLIDNPTATESEIRGIVLSSLKTGSIDEAYFGHLGLNKIIKVTIKNHGINCHFVLIWGIDKLGNPKLAHDGKKKMVYLYNVVTEPQYEI